MRIAVISSNTLPTPPIEAEIPQGWARSIHDFMSAITEGLVARGHDVTLFATGNSKTSAHLEWLWPEGTYTLFGTGNQLDGWATDPVLISKCFAMHLQRRYDLIYAFFPIEAATFSYFIDAPIVATLHGPGITFEKTIFPKLLKKPHIVAISDFQIASNPELSFATKIYHGIDTNFFSFSDSSAGYLLYLGRLDSKKGIEVAIKAANQLKVPLKIIGSGDAAYLQHLQSGAGKQVEFLGQLDKADVKKYLSEAKALVFPALWNEPFGLAIIESLSVGTPVIGFARGALPEIIQDGKTGYLVNLAEDSVRGNWLEQSYGEAGFTQAIKRLYALSDSAYLKMRQAARASAVASFDQETMVTNYEKLFEAILMKSDNNAA
ncbi:MAG TPA: glycosyltransferase [Candidatus Acidoferrum sp.]|nr:glycosyltransferase [Candidatus Acidoferrum sp.]